MDPHSEKLESFTGPVEVHGCAIAIGQGRCAKHTNVVYCACTTKLEDGVGIIDELEIRLQSATCNTAAKHCESKPWI